MNTLELQQLKDILAGSAWEVRGSLMKFVEQAVVEEVKDQRTLKQNNSIHKYCTEVANALNDAGLPVQTVLKEAMEIDWDQRIAKELLWRHAQVQKLGKESTTELTKTKEIDIVYNHVNRYLAKFGVHIPFPSEGIYSTRTDHDFDEIYEKDATVLNLD